jgi:hypothetical protein
MDCVEIASQNAEIGGARVAGQLDSCGRPSCPEQTERGQGDQEVTQRAPAQHEDSFNHLGCVRLHRSWGRDAIIACVR